MNLLELKNNSRAILDEATAALYTDANILEWINGGERDVAAKTGCLEEILSLTTTNGSRLVTITGNKVNAVELVIAGYTQFLPGGDVNWQDTSDHVWQDTSDNEWYDYLNNLWIPYPPIGNLRMTPHRMGHVSIHGESYPKYWFQWGDKLVVEPTPDDTYSLNVYVSKSPSDQMSADDDTPEIPLEFQDAILLYVATMGKLRARKYQDAAIKYGEYISVLQSLIDKYIRRRPARIQDIRIPDVLRVRQ